MEMCDLAISAVINGKEQPATLYVHGSILIYSANDEIDVVEANPQGINHRILVLDAAVRKNEGPMKGTCKPFLFKKTVEGKQYDQVTVRVSDGYPSGEGSKTVDVTYLG